MVLGPLSLKFENNCNILICGATGAGKSITAIDLILHRQLVFKKHIDRVIYFYLDEQNIFDDAKAVDKDIIFVNTREEFELELAKKHDHVLVCFDDHMIQALTADRNYFIDFLLRRSHHSRCTTIWQSQLLFPHNLRALTLNAHYILLKKNYHESQVMYFLRNLMPHNWRSIFKAYKYVVDSQPFGTFTIVNHPNTKQELRFRDFYIPKTGGKIFKP